MDIPRQEKQETVPAFVLRACSIMEKTHKSGEGVKTSARLAEEAETKRERIERLESEFSYAIFHGFDVLATSLTVESSDS